MASQRTRRSEYQAEERLERIRSQAFAVGIVPRPDALVALSASPGGNERLLALLLMRRRQEQQAIDETLLTAAGDRLADPDELVRYQAMIVVSQFAASHPDRVFELVARSAPRVGEESRCDLGCVLLEELLERDFETYFGLTREAVSSGNHSMLDVLGCAWFDDFGANYERAQRFIAETRARVETRDAPRDERVWPTRSPLAPAQ